MSAGISVIRSIALEVLTKATWRPASKARPPQFEPPPVNGYSIMPPTDGGVNRPSCQAPVILRRHCALSQGVSPNASLGPMPLGASGAGATGKG